MDGIPDSFFAIFSQMPFDADWFFESHCSHALAVLKGMISSAGIFEPL
jgi:hypothetical protein